MLEQMDSLKWDRNSEHMREFFRLQPAYEQLIEEVSFTIKNRLNHSGLEFAHIAKRVKSPESFLEKIDRERYQDPIREITDLAGVRLVFLYLDDLPAIEAMIRKAFIVDEKVNKESVNMDKFGYLAKHYIVKVRKSVAGERYTHLKDLKCEIQVRTTIQDAWAILSHHLMYKKEKDVPKFIKRRIHQLAAVLENADQQFNEIEEKRRGYRAKLENPKTPLRELLKEKTNKDSVVAFLRRKFPKMEISVSDTHIATVFEHLDIDGYPTIKALNDILTKTQEVRKLYTRDVMSNTSLAQLAVALGCTDSEYRKATFFGENATEVIAGFKASKPRAQKVTKKKSKTI